MLRFPNFPVLTDRRFLSAGPGNGATTSSPPGKSRMVGRAQVNPHNFIDLEDPTKEPSIEGGIAPHTLRHSEPIDPNEVDMINVEEL